MHSHVPGLTLWPLPTTPTPRAGQAALCACRGLHAQGHRRLCAVQEDVGAAQPARKVMHTRRLPCATLQVSMLSLRSRCRPWARVSWYAGLAVAGHQVDVGLASVYDGVEKSIDWAGWHHVSSRLYFIGRQAWCLLICFGGICPMPPVRGWSCVCVVRQVSLLDE